MAQDHSQFHSSNAFCGNAGPEELKHLADLLNELTDGQLKMLAENCGIEFSVDEGQLDRDDFMNVLDEAEREDFYREYRRIVKHNVCLMSEG